MPTPDERETLNKSLKARQAQANKDLLIFRYNNPVSHPSSEEASVGNWPVSTEDPTAKEIHEQELRDASNNRPNKLINPKYREVIPVSSLEVTEDALACYDIETNKIILYQFEDGEFKENYLSDEKNTLSGRKYIEGDPSVTYHVLLHETTHRDHWVLDGAGSFGDSSYYNSRVNRLTETTAYAVEYLAAAYQYTTAKNLNIETLQVNGKEEPIEYIITPYPGLKEYIDENGFDINNPENIRGVVAIASQSWHTNMQDSYDFDTFTAIQDYVDTPDKTTNYYNFSTMLAETSPERLAQKYNTVSTEMLKDVYVGYNTTVDLTNCRDLLDTFESAPSRYFEHFPQYNPDKNETIISDPRKVAEILAINAHLEKLGLKTDAEKDKYMQTFLQNVASRKEGVDEELRNILLSYNAIIQYSDGLISRRFSDRTIVSDNKAFFSIPNAPELTNTNQQGKPDKTQSEPTLAQLALKNQHYR